MQNSHLPELPVHQAQRHSGRRGALAGAIAAGLLFAGAAFAHHGWSEYEGSKPVTLSGAVVDAGYDNPHGFIRLKTADKVWRVILAPPARMESRGLPRSALKAGATATVVGYVNRTDAQELRAERITMEGGAAVELR